MAFKRTYAAYNKELMARAVGRGLSISTKQSVEICSNIRNKTLKRAKQILEDAVGIKKPVRYTRFNKGVGHKPGIAAGRYPQKAAGSILTVLKSAEANAQVKGLNTAHLHVVHCHANKASQPMHQGRQRGTSMKRSHVEIVLQERAEKQTKKEKTKERKEDK